MTGAPLRIGLIGYGGIGRSIVEALSTCSGVPFSIVAMLCRTAPDDPPGPVVSTVEALLAEAPDVIVECAGHGAVIAYAEATLSAGVRTMIVSIGALADPVLLARLSRAARRGGTRLILAAGAMAGIEALAAARIGGLDRVRYTGRKPPHAWLGTPAEDLVDLTALVAPATFYAGNARNAAQLYPKNSNVAATVALAGIGFDRTEVDLVADPGISVNVHELEFAGADGSFRVSIAGKPSLANPKTSALTAHSVARLLSGLAEPIVI